MNTRLPYIDVAKGIGIILVMMNHIGVPEPFQGLYAAKVPIFFFLSGIFFLKSYNSGNYINKKVQSIFVPFIIYYVLSYLLFYAVDVVKPDLFTGDQTFSITDIFTKRQLFNGPLWFLISLFLVESIFYLIHTFTHKECHRASLVIFLACLGFYLSEKDIFLPCWLDASLVALFYFYCGHLFGLSGMTEMHPGLKWTIFIGACAYILFLLMPVDISMSTNEYSNNILAITSGSMIILFILCLSKLLTSLTFISWFGSNSLVLLCTHHLVYRPIKIAIMQIGIDNAWILFLSTILVEVAIIWLVNNKYPILAGKYRYNGRLLKRVFHNDC